MNAEIDMLARTLITVLGVFILLVSAVLIYVFWLWLELHREVRRGLRRAEVDRDANGRRIRERI